MNPLNVSYDAHFDCALFIDRTIEPRRVFCDEVGSGSILIEHNGIDGKVYGASVYGFKRYWQHHPEELSEIMETHLGLDKSVSMEYYYEAIAEMATSKGEEE